MAWHYKGGLISSDELEGFCGFVYLIENVRDNRFYVGKKLLQLRKTKVVKGKKKRILVNSGWENYWGSNKLLQEDVAELGEAAFKRTILHLCRAKGELSYYEAKEQFERNVLLDPKYYNDHIWVRVHRKHLQKALDLAHKHGMIKL